MKATLDFETQLHSVPVRNEKVTVEESSGHLLVGVELRYHGVIGLVANFVRARRHKRYALAGIARELFERVDSSVTVEQLVDWLCEQEKLTFLEGRALVLQYLRDLMTRGLVVIAADPGASS